MPIGDDLYVNNTLEVLKAFLLYSKPVFKRKNIQSGIGLKKEDLNKTPYDGFNQLGTKKHKASSKMFSSRKENLLYDYHIVRLPSNEHGKFYGITPLGISYFCEYSKHIDLEIFESIFTHLKFFYEKGKPKGEESYLKKLESITTNKILRDSPDAINYITIEFKEAFSNFKIKHSVVDYILIKLIYTPTSGMEILLSELIYSKGSEEEDDYGAYSLSSDSNEGTLMIFDRDVDVHNFNYILSKFLIKSFLHSLYCGTVQWCNVFKDNGKNKNKNNYDEIPMEHVKLVKTDLKMKHRILDSFKGEGFEVVKEFQNEISKAVKLYTTAFEKEEVNLIQK
ncbi:MAG: hypothetical protein OEL81_05900 [Nitrosopumilus sp.]|nr:hypothetical protein [Nitrosopumilus sp.]